MLIATKIGAHVSIAGGIWNAPVRALAEGCETFQCFTRSPQGGPAPELTDSVISKFKEEMTKANMDSFHIHAPYYINLASLTDNIRKSSIRVLREELERGSILGAKYLMAHPGSYSGQSLSEAIAKVDESISEILSGYKGVCAFLVEISAGTGNILGSTFQEIADMISDAKGRSGFGGVCFDTCHAFASGYDFRTPEGATTVLAEFDKIIGLDWLKLTHVNDSKVGLGEHRDRHEHIGQGHIGRSGLASLLNTPEFSRMDWILETEADRRFEDVAILKNIRQS